MTFEKSANASECFWLLCTRQVLDRDAMLSPCPATHPSHQECCSFQGTASFSKVVSLHLLVPYLSSLSSHWFSPLCVLASLFSYLTLNAVRSIGPLTAIQTWRPWNMSRDGQWSCEGSGEHVWGNWDGSIWSRGASGEILLLPTAPWKEVAGRWGLASALT